MVTKKKFAQKAPKKQHLPPEGTREKLLKAALQLFSRHGYDGTSTKQICDAAGANVAAVTYHFQTKENLLKSIFAEHVDRDASSILLILKEVNSADELKVRIRVYCETMFEIVGREPEFHRLVMREASVNPIAFEVMKSGFEVVHSSLHKFFKDAKKKGFIAKDVDETLIEHVLFRLFVNLPSDGIAEKMDPQFDFSDSRKREHYVDRVLRMFFSGILATEK